MRTYNKDTNTITVNQTGLVAHCHHYNTFLQRTFQDALGDSFNPTLIESARRITTEMLQQGDYDSSEVVAKATEFFSESGHGVLDFSKIKDGYGQVLMPSSHFAIAWFEKFGNATAGVCFFAAGYALAVLNVTYNLNLTANNISEMACLAIDPETYPMCIFEVKP